MSNNCFLLDSSINVRGKKHSAGGATKNVAGRPKGPKLGLKVYDGQRVPSGTVLLKQKNLVTMPGWNVDFGRPNNCTELWAKCHGRVMMTTELVDPKISSSLVANSLPPAMKPNQKIFRQYLHIVPDRQHQFFKLVDQH